MTRWWPRLTPARRAYLEALADGQPHILSVRSHTGFACRQLGWCAFAVRDLRTGEVMPKPAGARFYDENGVKLYEFLNGSAEMITDAGRRMLEP